MTERGKEPGRRRPGETFAGFLTGDSARDQRNIDILLDTIAEVSSTIDLDALLTSIVDKTLEFTKAERGILMLFDEKGELRVRVARDSLHRTLDTAGLIYSRSVPQKVAKEGKALHMIDAASQNEASLGQSILDLKLLTIMCVPLKVMDKTIGVLYVDSRASARGEFGESDLLLFKALSYQLAIAIENARLLKEALEKERMQQELLIARDIQENLLPPAKLSLPGYDVYGFSRPCDETGGDYFDYVRTREGKLGLAIGDVSGHGIGAALFMATARALLRAFLSTGSDLGRVIGDLNNALERDMGAGKFMTLFYGEIDLAERMLRFVKAGHNEPVIYRAGKDAFEEIDAPGMALGFLRDFEYEVAGPVSLETGDVLLLYTDGIPEARNAEKEQFGMERMLAALRARRTRSAKEIAEGIHREVAEFAGRRGFEDDLTLIVVKVLEPGAVARPAGV